ncbi:MAG: pimA [Ilumatobacteraceae bacterium]|nr:pimA [Ilumatobacteraceae bacterium]
MQPASPTSDVAPRRLRIGIICPYSLSIPGGVQEQVMGLARELRRMGLEARVLGPCDGPPPASFVSPLGNSLPTASNGSIAPIAPDPAAQLRTIRLLNEEDFDVLHLHEPLAPGPTETALFLHPAPIVATFHAAGVSNGYKYLRAPLGKLADNIAVRVAVSKDAKALIQDSFGGEYEVFFNGLELPRYRTATPRDLPGRTIFFCGRHEERKGLGVLLAAFGDLPDDVRLLIGSDGPDTKRLRSSVGEHPRIEWLGRLSDADKIAYLKGATVFCAPSLRGESFGVVLIEAMAAGTPVVASSLQGYQNVATDEVDALLCEPGDAAALAAALRRVLDDDALAERLQQAGQARADDFSMTTLAEQYVAIYERLAADRLARRAGRTASGDGRVSRLRRFLGRMMHPVAGS